MAALVYAEYLSEDPRSTVVPKSQVIAHSVKDPADFKRSIRLVSVSCDSIVRRKRQSCEMVRNKYRSRGAQKSRTRPRSSEYSTPAAAPTDAANYIES